MSNGTLAECTGRACGYSVWESTVGCSSGSGSCFEASFITAQESDFHDHRLKAATEKLKRALGEIPHDPHGRKLCILNTNMGLLLAWVHHGITIPPDAVTSEHDDATIAKALKLENLPPAHENIPVHR